MSNFINSRQHSARTDYICDLCGGTIFKGQQYVRHKAQYSGRFEVFTVHIHCDAVMRQYVRTHRAEEKADVKEINDWVRKSACQGAACGLSNVCGHRYSAWCCKKALEALLPETVRGAAVASAEETVRRCDDG